MAWGTLVPKRELNPCPLQGKSLNHWTTREAWPASFRMQLASPFLPLNSALADVCRAKTPTPCFPTFISSNPVSLLLYHTCRVYFLRQFHRTLKLLRVNVKYAMVDTVRSVLFFHKNITIAHEGEVLLPKSTIPWVVILENSLPQPWLERVPLSLDLPLLI